MFAPQLKSAPTPTTFLRRRVTATSPITGKVVAATVAAKESDALAKAQQSADAAKLRALGYAVPEPVTAYDLRVAVTAFQQRVNVPPTGQLDAPTREALAAALAQKATVDVPRPPAPPVPGAVQVAPAVEVRATDTASKVLATAVTSIPSAVAATVRDTGPSAPIVTAADLERGFVAPVAGATAAAPTPPPQPDQIPSVERSPVGVTVEAPDWVWMVLGGAAVIAGGVYIYRRKVRRA